MGTTIGLSELLKELRTGSSQQHFVLSQIRQLKLHFTITQSNEIQQIEMI